MSMNDTLLGVAGPVKATVMATILAAGSAIAQDATTAAKVVGKGGFSAIPTLGEITEFQLTGLLVVFMVLGGLTVMLYLLAWILRTVAPDQFHCRPKSAPAAKPAPAVKPAAVPTLPAAAALQPATPTPTIHPGLSDEELLSILAVAATEGIGQPVSIVRFRPMDSMDWVWSVQGRVGLHTGRML